MSRLVAAPPPNRVRSPTDRQFASGCSPRRFGPTQLPSATELWHTPTRTFTVLMWRPHRRTHSRMLFAGIQARSELDPRLNFGGDAFSSSEGERKLMTHFVVRSAHSDWLRRSRAVSFAI